MKHTEKFYTVKSTFLIAAFLMAISASTLTFSGTKNNAANADTAKMLEKGLNSSNRGLAQSSIYFAGYYGFSWTVDPLSNVLNDSSKETVIKILAAYSLYRIGEEKGMEAIKAVSIRDKNHMLQQTCEFIYTDYLSGKAVISRE